MTAAATTAQRRNGNVFSNDGGSLNGFINVDNDNDGVDVGYQRWAGAAGAILGSLLELQLLADVDQLDRRRGRCGRRPGSGQLPKKKNKE